MAWDQRGNDRPLEIIERREIIIGTAGKRKQTAK